MKFRFFSEFFKKLNSKFKDPNKFYYQPKYYLFGIASIYLYHKYLSFPKINKPINVEVSNYFKKKENFSGVSRPDLISALISESSKSVTLIFSQNKVGKSKLLEEFSKSNQNSLLIDPLTTDPDQLGYQISSKIEKLAELIGILEAIFENAKETTILIDHFEVFPYDFQKLWISHMFYWKRNNICKVIIATNNIKALKSLKSYETINVFTVPELKYHQICEAFHDFEGFNQEETEKLLSETGPDLEYLSEMIRRKISCEDFLNEKRRTITEQLKKIGKDEEMLTKIIFSVMSINPKRPLGDVYSDSEIGQKFIEKGLMYEEANSSAYFKNKFIVKVVTEFISKT